MKRGLLDQEQPMGLMGGLANAFENPMTLGGLSLLSGGGWNGAFQGMRTGAGMQDRRREQAQQAQQQQQFDTAMQGLANMPPEMAALARAGGPQSVPAILKHLMDQRDPSRQLDMDYKKAQIGKLQREASGTGPADYGKSGSIFQGQDGRFYSIQFGSDGSRRIEPVETGGEALAPARGVQVVGDQIINSATGGEVRNVGPQLAAGEASKAIGSAEGKATGESMTAYRSMTSKLPGLETVVSRLDELADKATYTLAGRGIDEGRRQLGMDPRESAIARAEYIAVVDNQILPLLRDTFGAAFTVKEGETLRSTLGDANKSPAEKKVVLNAFISQKKRDIEANALQSMQGAQPQAGGPVIINGYQIEAE